MNSHVASIVARMRGLEGELETELARRQLELSYTVDHGKVKFEEHILRYHRRIRSGWWRYVIDARPSVLLTAPLIYATFLPFAFLDLSVGIYQFTCFRVYGIAQVRRADHLVFDRGQLAYLNWFERVNCRFCSYANGVISYAREIAARTEQYWCPIKHSRRMQRLVATTLRPYVCSVPTPAGFATTMVSWTVRLSLRAPDPMHEFMTSVLVTERNTPPICGVAGAQS